jgi:hypothetical protein
MMLDTWIAFISSGEVVVPGACYLEMILAGVKAHLGPQVPKTEKKKTSSPVDRSWQDFVNFRYFQIPSTLWKIHHV